MSTGSALSANPRWIFYTTISRHEERFARELARMQEFSASYVVVECDLLELLTDPPFMSRFPPKRLHRLILEWELRFPKTHWKFLCDRHMAQTVTVRIFDRYLMQQEVVTSEPEPKTAARRGRTATPRVCLPLTSSKR